MSNFGFGSLFGNTEDLARRAGIVSRGDQALILSTYSQGFGNELNLSEIEFSDYNQPPYKGGDEDLPVSSEERRNLRNASFAYLRSKLKENGPDRGKIPAWSSQYIKTFDPNGPNVSPPVPDSEPRIEDSKRLLKRFLQDRSFLVFEYPVQEGLKEFSILPFFENISISENQKANFAVYDLIGRAGNIYGYMGAKSRQFSLSFKMNVMHIQHLMHNEGLVIQDFSQSFSDPENRDQIKQRFLYPQISKGSKSPDSKVNSAKLASEDFGELRSQDPNYLANTLFTGVGPPPPITLEDTENADLFRLQIVTSNRVINRTINDVLWWINLVRTSVLNNSNNAIYGPPIIRINHGILYNNVPCICTNFSIRESQGTPYDVVTNFPLVFDITMSLEEIRNSFGEYTPGDPTKGDNVTGWNGLKKHGTMDPYNGPWGVR